MHRCQTYLKHGTHFSMSTPHLTGSTAVARGARRSNVRVTERARRWAAVERGDAGRHAEDQHVRAGYGRAPRAALQPLTSFAAMRRGGPRFAGTLKEWTARAREQLSRCRLFQAPCRGLARCLKYVRTDGVEVAISRFRSLESVGNLGVIRATPRNGRVTGTLTPASRGVHSHFP